MKSLNVFGANLKQAFVLFFIFFALLEGFWKLEPHFGLLTIYRLEE